MAIVWLIIGGYSHVIHYLLTGMILQVSGIFVAWDLWEQLPAHQPYLMIRMVEALW